MTWSVEGRTATVIQKPKNRKPLFFPFFSDPSIPSCSFSSSTFSHHTIHIPSSHSLMTQTMISHLDIRGASLGCLRILPDDLIIRAIFSLLGPKVSLRVLLILITQNNMAQGNRLGNATKLNFLANNRIFAHYLWSQDTSTFSPATSSCGNRFASTIETRARCVYHSVALGC